MDADAEQDQRRPAWGRVASGWATRSELTDANMAPVQRLAHRPNEAVRWAVIDAYASYRNDDGPYRAPARVLAVLAR